MNRYGIMIVTSIIVTIHLLWCLSGILRNRMPLVIINADQIGRKTVSGSSIGSNSPGIQKRARLDNAYWMISLKYAVSVLSLASNGKAHLHTT